MAGLRISNGNFCPLARSQGVPASRVRVVLFIRVATTEGSVYIVP